MEQRIERAAEDHTPALLTRAEPHVDNRVRDPDHVRVVLDDQDRVALVSQLSQDRDQPLVVARMKANRRLVQYVQGVNQRRPQRCREIDALRLSARQRRRQTIERQVVQADVAEESETLANFAKHLVGDRSFLLRQREAGKEGVGVTDCQAADRVDRAATDLDVAGFAAQARAATFRTRQVAPIAAEKYPDVNLVLLALEPPEESLHSLVAGAVAVDHETLLVVGQFGPGHVEAQTAHLGGALQVGQLRAVVRLAPGFNRVLRDRLRGIGDHEIHVEFDDVPESVAQRTRAKGVVERKQPRLRQLVRNVTLAAFESFAEPKRDRFGLAFSRLWRKLNREGRPTPLGVRGFNRVGETGAQIAFDLDAVHDHLKRPAISQRRAVDLVQRDRPAIDIQTAEPLATQRRKRFRNRIDQIRKIRLRGIDRPLFGRGRFFVLWLGHGRHGRRRDHRHIEANQQPRSFRQISEPPRNDFGGLANHLTPAIPAVGAAHARV